MRGNRSLATALAGITAAAGVIANLGLCFAPIFWPGWSALRTLGACALTGFVVGLAQAAT